MEQRASQATACLERVWAALQEVHAEIPSAVMLVYAKHTRQPRQNGGVLYGHFVRRVWRAAGRKRHEVGVSPYLFDRPQEVLQVLLHEAAHAVLFERDPACTVHYGGCSKEDRYYHRREFADLCKAWGLECEFVNRRYGFAVTKWPGSRVSPAYRAALEILRTDLPLGVKTDPAHHTGPQLFRLVCPCGRCIYARLPVAHTGKITCAACNREFQPVKPLPPLHFG